MVLKFCVHYGKVFAVCHERHIHTGQPCISLYIHDVTSGNIHNVIPLFRWFKFTLKPPYSIGHDNLRLAIWDTSF